MAAVLAIAAALLCFAVVIVVWKAQRALHGSERHVAAEQDLPFIASPVSRQPNPGLEAISAPALFRSAQAFEGRFYLAGPAGLYVYSSDGLLQKIYRPGQDFPASPLGVMAVGTLIDSHQPELLIATGGEGVLAFDGARFRQVRGTEAESRNVTALLPLASGRLLIGTAKRGLLEYDGKTLRRFAATTNDLFVTALAGDETELWIGTINSGVLRWRGGQIQAIGEAEGLPDARVDSIALTPDAVYVGTPGGVAELRDGKLARVLARGRYTHALFAEQDALYAGQMEGGILRVGMASTPGSVARRPIAAHPQATAETRRDFHATDTAVEQFLRVGDVRYAVTGDQLLRLESDGEWQKVLGGNDSLLTDRNISALAVASDGRLWIGYFDRGLDIIPAGSGRPVHIENEQVFCVNRIVEDTRQGLIAVATANGLVLFDRDGRQKQVLTRDSGLIANHVTDVAMYGDGLVAGTPAGITFLDTSGAHSMYAFQGLVNNHVYALGTGGNGLLIGTLGGLSLINDGAVRRNLTTGNSGLKANWITALVSIGGEWLAGTYGAGILRMDADAKVVATDATVQGTIINPGAMTEDQHLLLAGTMGKGLLVSDANGIRWKTVTGGLPSLNVTALAIANGYVYVGTDNGLVKIAEGEL